MSNRRAVEAGRVARWLGDDLGRMLRDWRPPERPDPDEAPGRRPARRRAPEPTWGRTDAAEAARRLVQRRALFPVLEALARPEVRGLHHVLAVRPPLILAPNHVSHADAPLVLKALPERIRERTLVPAAADYFFDRRWLSVLVTLAMNAVPFDRHHDIADSVRRCERLLRHGHSIVLFPEGTRSPTGRLRGFKAGVAHLAVGTGAPVIPVFVQGTHALLPRGAALPRPSAVAVHFGEPLHALPDETARQFNERLERAVSSLGAGVRAHAHRDRVPRRPGWRETWRIQRGEVVPLDGAAVTAATGAGGPEDGWRARWRSTTPR